MNIFESSPALSENTFDGDNRAIRFSASNAILSQNIIESSNSYGLYIVNAASPSIHYNPVYDFGGYNKIINNGSYGAYLLSDCYPSFGRNSGGNYAPGNNEIYNNSNYEIYSTNTDLIYAEDNWWGEEVGPGHDPPLYGNIDWQPYLTSPPQRASGSGSSASAEFAYDESSPYPEDIQYAYYEHYNTKYEKSANQFNEHFLTNSTSDFNILSVIEFVKNLNYYLEDEEILNDIRKQKEKVGNNDTDFELTYAEVNILSRLKKHDEAFSIIDKQLEAKITDDQRNRLLFQKAVIYIYALNEPEKGKVYLCEVIDNTSKDDEYHQLAQDELEIIEGETPSLEKNVVVHEDQKLPSEYKLHGNYPNPFNAVTRIKFSLPLTSQITIEIYTISGKKMKTLARAVYPAGVHETAWDGIDDRGNSVSSGLYIYRFRARATERASLSYQKSGKMIFVK